MKVELEGGEYDYNCGNASACRFYGVFDDITRTVIERLSGVTFAREENEPKSFS